MSTLRKAITIIETVVANQANGMTFAEIVAATGTPKASAHRILKELVTMGMLTFSPDTSRYRGSLKLASMGCSVTANFDLRTLVHPHLQKLHEATHHTANLAIRDGDDGVYLDKIETEEYGIRLFSEVGKTLSVALHGPGQGPPGLPAGKRAQPHCQRPLAVSYLENDYRRQGPGRRTRGNPRAGLRPGSGRNYAWA